MSNTGSDPKSKFLPIGRKKLSNPPVGDYTKITPAVKTISELNFEGNIIPHTWYGKVVKQTKRGSKPHLNAIVILADIVYWYRYTIVRDENTGTIKEYRKKFLYDKLQKSYGDYAEMLGISAKVAKEAIDFLKKEGLISCEFACYKPNKSAYINNQMYIEPNASKIAEITFSLPKETKSVRTTYRNREVRPTEIGNTYTEITKTNNTNKDKGSLKDLPEALSLDLCNTQEGSFRNTGSSFAAPNKDSEKEKTVVSETVQLDGLTKQSNDESLERLAKAAQSLTKNFDTRPYVALEEKPSFNLNDSTSLQNFENLKWLRRNRDHMHYYCKWAYETTQPSICEFIYEANEMFIPIEYSKRTYELWNERGWTFAESGDPIKHWVGALKKFYQKRRHEKEHAHESYKTCEVCGVKYRTPVLDYRPEEGDEPECSGCHSKIKFDVILPEEN